MGYWNGKTVIITGGGRAVLKDGRCLFQGDPEEVFQSGCLETAFDLRVQRLQTPDGWKYYFSDKNLIKTE